MTNKT